MWCLDANARYARLQDAQFACSGRAEINDSAPDERTAVGDPHGNASVVSKVGYADYRAEG
jgi:hypothetical protein